MQDGAVTGGPGLPAEAAPAARSSGLSAAPEHHTHKYAFIDALRGYAVLMVITNHVGDPFRNLPYPLRKLTSFGWHGVQLFFLVSCVTLLLSWRSDEAKGRASATDFWIRRLFRIAPMYYLAAVLYYVIERPPSGFDLGQLLATLTFVNAWHPALTPTVADRWTVVQGGWSIGVEFTFYLVFPAIAAAVRSMRMALLVLVLALAIGCVANPIMQGLLHDCCAPLAIREFLYYWFPNQLPVFALGAILYLLLTRTWAGPPGAFASVLGRYGTGIVVACGAACVLIANLPFPEALPFAAPLYVPRFLVTSLVFMVAVLALGNSPRSVFVNRFVCSLGQLSFSAYLLHFAVLHKLSFLLPGIFDLRAAGWRAVGACLGLWAVVVPITYGLSAATYRFVETPMIAAGRRLLAMRRRRRSGTRTPAIAVDPAAR